METEKVMVAVEAALASDDEYVVNTATAVQKRLDFSDPAVQELRATVRDFLKSHPKRHRVPRPEEAFMAILAVDLIRGRGKRLPGKCEIVGLVGAQSHFGVPR